MGFTKAQIVTALKQLAGENHEQWMENVADWHSLDTLPELEQPMRSIDDVATSSGMYHLIDPVFHLTGPHQPLAIRSALSIGVESVYYVDASVDPDSTPSTSNLLSHSTWCARCPVDSRLRSTRSHLQAMPRHFTRRQAALSMSFCCSFTLVKRTSALCWFRTRCPSLSLVLSASHTNTHRTSSSLVLPTSNRQSNVRMQLQAS